MEGELCRIDIVIEDYRLHASVESEHTFVELSEDCFHLHHRGCGFHFQDNLANVELLNTSHQWRLGTEDAMSKNLAEEVAESHRHFAHHGIVAVLEVNDDYLGERRIAKSATVFEFVIEIAFIVVVDDVIKDGMVGESSLYNYMPGTIFSTGTSRHLFEHVESTFVGAEIGEIEQRVGIEHTHDIHTAEIELDTNYH